MPEELFDRAEEYEAMLNQGIGLSGESQEFFLTGRVQDLFNQLPSTPLRILDFGCGVGKTCVHLAEVFPKAQIVGADLSETTVAHAQMRYGSERIRFACISELSRFKPFHLCYVN